MSSDTPTLPERHVKLFRNGRNQAVRIPREFELPGEDAVIRKDGDRFILEPAPKKSLLDVLATLDDLDDDFPETEDPSPEPVDPFSRESSPAAPTRRR
jgi:antitoxin VapB